MESATLFTFFHLFTCVLIVLTLFEQLFVFVQEEITSALNFIFKKIDKNFPGIHNALNLFVERKQIYQLPE